MRIRPYLKGEQKKLSIDQMRNPCVEDREECFIKIYNDLNLRESKFEFNHVFGKEVKQLEVYQEVSPLVTSVLDGYNVCIAAYG